MTWRLGHRPSLDALRGIAVLLVLAGHFGVPGMAAGGSVGVSLFFVLSGYLITALLIGERDRAGRVDLRAFYMRRARRLLPALAVLLVVIGTWAAVTGHLSAWLPGAVSVALYVGNWTWLSGNPLVGIAHAWSLAVEEQFYLVWPVVLLVLVRGGIGRAIAGASVIVAVSFAVTAILLPDYDRAMYGSDVRAKELLLGSLVALVSARRGADFRVPTAAAVVSAALLVVVATNVVKPLSPLLTAVPGAVLVAWFAAHPTFANWRPLTFTGRISYGLYLYHFPLEAGPLNAFDGLALWPRIVALTVASYAAAIASWFVVERRFLRRHDNRVLGGQGVPGRAASERQDWPRWRRPRHEVGAGAGE